MDGRALLRVVTAALVFAAVVPALGSDFRVENKVFLGGEKEPAAQSTTIFHGGMVYDYLAEPAEVTIFDPVRGRFVLLDPTRRIKAELTLEVIGKAIDRVKTRLGDSDDPHTRFQASPSFDEQVDPSTGELVFQSDWMTYRVSGAATDDVESVRQYREFSDAYARLNTFLRPGSRPPFARLIVNEALEKRGEIPMKVELNLTLKKGLPPKRVNMRSEHHLIPQLVESDRRRVAQTDQFLAMFSSLSFSDYQAKMKK
jgi:hypothetical protein